MKKYVVCVVVLFSMTCATVHPWFGWFGGEEATKSKWLLSSPDDKKGKTRKIRRRKKLAKPIVLMPDEEPPEKCDPLDDAIRVSREERSYVDESLGYDVGVKDIAPGRKEKFRVDLNITSTVPINVSMKKDQVVVEQVYQHGRKYSGKRVPTGQVVSVDMDRIGSSWGMYKVPAWPHYVSCFEDRDKVDLTVRYHHAGNSYSSSGHTQDMSKLVFGQCPIYVKDILLVSKLVDSGQLTDWSGGETNKGYLKNIAGQKVCFDASINDIKFALSYVRHFLSNDISLGFNLPFVFRRHSLKLTMGSPKFEDTGDYFKAKYGECCDESFKKFVTDILKSKDSSLTESDSERGLGDVSLFVNFEFKSRHCERILAGIKFLFPTARERNIHKLWDPELGNGGFTEVSCFGSLLFGVNRWFNPHVMAQATYCFPARVPRRIPSYREFDASAEPTGAKVRALGDILALGELIRSKNETKFKEIDTSFRGFATESERIRIRKGAEVYFQIGNVIENVISEHGFLDLYYDGRFKGTDYIGDKLLDCMFNPEILKHNTYQIEHRVGGMFTWQFDDHVRATLGAIYSIAGRNIPKTIEANAAVSIEF